MRKNERITMVIVDTNAFVTANSDFLGVKSSLLPSFFSAITEKEIKLLNHPILCNEIERHVGDSSLCKDYQQLKTSLNKCKEILGGAGLDDAELVAKLSEYDIKQTLIEAFKESYTDAYMLGFPNPETIFEQYFSASPPFSQTGKKKNEFPDAFVIESIKDFIEEHPNDVILVVTSDTDWKSALESVREVEICENIDTAIKLINTMQSILDWRMIDVIFKSVYKEIVRDAKFVSDCEAYYLWDYETINDLEITDISVISINDNVTPLKITRESILLKTEVNLKVTGEAEIFDEDNSVWDSEDRTYIFEEYADISFEGEAEVECEIEIAFNFDNLDDSWVTNFKFTNKDDIPIKCADVTMKKIDAYEMALRSLREDKGLPRKHKK